MRILRSFTFFLFFALVAGHLGHGGSAQASSLSALSPVTAGPSAASPGPSSVGLTGGELSLLIGVADFDPTGSMGFLATSVDTSGALAGFSIGDLGGTGVLLAGTYIETQIDTVTNNVMALFSNDPGTIFGSSFAEFLIISITNPSVTLSDDYTGTLVGNFSIIGATAVPLPAAGVMFLSAFAGLFGLRMLRRAG